MTLKIDGVPIEKYDGVPPETIYQRTLADRIDHNLDIVFVNICPNLYSVHLDTHYAGPGNHIWNCLHESGLTDKLYKTSEDINLLSHKIGLVNMLQKATPKNIQELSFFEIKTAQESLSERIQNYRPKIVAFNGKQAYEIYYGKSLGRDFHFGKQSIKFDNDTTDTYVYVLPTSEARGPSNRLLPKHTDKVPFYFGLKQFKDNLNGQLNTITDKDITFPDFKIILEQARDEISDSEGNTSNLDENNQLNDSKSTNSKVKRNYRLNNLPFSAIPVNILENYESQRLKKKEVVISVTEKCFFEKSSVKKLANNLKDGLNNTISSVINSVVMCDQGSNGAPSVTSSISDEITADSDSFATSGAVFKNEPTIIKTELAESNQSIVKTFSPILNIPSVQKIQPKPTVINLSSGNSTIKQILSAPVVNYNQQSVSLRNITAQTVNLNQNIKISQQKPTIAHYSQPTKLTTNLPQNFKIVNTADRTMKLPVQKINEKVVPPSTSGNNINNNINLVKIQNVQVLNESQLNTQSIRKDQNTIIMLNQNKNTNNMKIVSKKNNETVQPQTQPTTSSGNKNITNNNNIIKPKCNAKIQLAPNSEPQCQTTNKPNLETKTLKESLCEPVIDRYQAVENMPYITYELVIQDKYRYGDYYTFNDNPPAKVSDEEEKKILNQVVQLHYNHEDNELNKCLPVKRHFSELKDATSTILNSAEAKRTCNLNLMSL